MPPVVAMNRVVKLGSMALLFSVFAASMVRAGVTYGDLAPGARGYGEQTGVAAEICRDHLFDPSSSPARLPVGYRLLTATEYGKDDPGVAALLAKEPRYASYAVGSLCFMISDTFDVDGVAVHPSGPIPMAFWWAHARTTEAAAHDPRKKGSQQWLQLASWYSDKGTDQARIRAIDPMAQFVDVSVTRVGPQSWRLRLPVGNETVEAEVRTDGKRIRRKKPEPGFMTVPFTGDSAHLFTVFTYFGHHHQSAEGTWRATGAGPFSTSFEIEPAAFPTFFQDGWQARFGLYEVGR